MISARKTGTKMISLMAALAAIMLASSIGLAEERYWVIAPGVGIGDARLGMRRAQVEEVLSEIPCPDWAFAAEFYRDRLLRIATACGGAVRLESGIQVGSDFRKVLRQFGPPDQTLITEDGRYDGAIAYWVPYPHAGIAFRVIEHGGDVTVQSIRIIPAAVTTADR